MHGILNILPVPKPSSRPNEENPILSPNHELPAPHDMLLEEGDSKLPPQTDDGRKKFPLWILPLIGLLIILFAGGTYFLNIQKQSKKVVLPINPSPIVSPIPDPTTNWTTYVGEGYELKYPSHWRITDDKQVQYMSFFDPLQMENEANNGGGTINTPKRFVNVSWFDTKRSVKQFVDDAVKGPEYNGVDPERKPISVNSLTGEIYKVSGEGYKGYNIALSHGARIYIVNIPFSKTDSDSDIHTILSTLKFLDNDQKIAASSLSTPFPIYPNAKLINQSTNPCNEKADMPDFCFKKMSIWESSDDGDVIKNWYFKRYVKVRMGMWTEWLW